jgi:hypothetical protein
MERSIADWYALQPRVRRLWAFWVQARAASIGTGQIRAVVQLEPSADGNEIGPSWVANAATWENELRLRLACAVRLERFRSDDQLLGEESELGFERPLVTAQSWRDPTG